jgi:hypothetical protein
MQKHLRSALLLCLFCQPEISAANDPGIQCPANLTLNVTDINCRTSVVFPAARMQGACSLLGSVEAFWTDNGTGKSQKYKVTIPIDTRNCRGVFAQILRRKKRTDSTQMFLRKICATESA